MFSKSQPIAVFILRTTGDVFSMFCNDDSQLQRNTRQNARYIYICNFKQVNYPKFFNIMKRILKTLLNRVFPPIDALEHPCRPLLFKRSC